MQAGQEVEKGALAAPGRTDYGPCLAALDGPGEVAEDWLLRVVREAPGNVPANLVLGVIRIDQQRYAEAEQYLRALPQAMPGNPLPRRLLAAALIAQDKAAEAGRDVSSISKALVSGGALFPSLREEYKSRGVSVLQCYATADVGVIAYESEAMEGMIVDEGVIIEIVRPGTGEPLPAGEVGEVVVTNFNQTYPMIRFGTGDLSAIMPGASPCGRTNVRIKGWMGRADQTTKIKGMFVHPSQVADVMKAHGEIEKLRFVVTRHNEQDALIVKAECHTPEAEGLADAVAQTVQKVCRVRGWVELVPSGSLPNDGLVIADERPATT